MKLHLCEQIEGIGVSNTPYGAKTVVAVFIERLAEIEPATLFRKVKVKKLL